MTKRIGSDIGGCQISWGGANGGGGDDSILLLVFFIIYSLEYKVFCYQINNRIIILIICKPNMYKIPFKMWHVGNDGVDFIH